MATGDELQGMDDDELLGLNEDLYADKYSGPTWDFYKHARVHYELLRRLSAGNPQVQITHDCALEMTPADMRLALAGMTAERRWIVMGGFCSECGKDLAHRGTIGRLAHYAGHDPNAEPERSDGHRELPPPDYDVDRLPRGV